MGDDGHVAAPEQVCECVQMKKLLLRVAVALWYTLTRPTTTDATAEDAHDPVLGAPTAGLGLEAKVRLQSAKMTVLRDERNHARAQVKELERQLAAAQAASGRWGDERNRLQKALSKAENESRANTKKL